MATVVVYGDAADGRIESGDTAAVYANAREGGTLSVTTTSNLMNVGQHYIPVSTMWCWEGFLGFDTTSIGSHTACQLLMKITTDNSVTDFTVEARLYDWGATLTTADWVAGSALSGNTLLATLDTSTLVAGYNTFTDVALLGNINTSGFTRILLNSDRHRLGTTPTISVSEHLVFGAADQAGTSSDPALVFTTISVSSDEILTPDSDVAVNGWTTDTGSSVALVLAIDELTASDTDYIQSPAGPTTAQYYETALETKADPLSSSGHIVHYRYQKNVAGGNVGLTVDLNQGTLGSDIAYEPADASFTFLSGSASPRAQSFTWGGGGISSAWLKLSISGSPADSVLVSIQEDVAGNPSGTVLASQSIAGSSLTGTATMTEFVLTNRAFSSSGTLWIVAERTVNDAGSYKIHGLSPGSYSGGSHKSYVAGVWGAQAMDLNFRITASNRVASWSHTNIPNTWTQQDQTLSGAQADSITDYSDLRLRFIPDMVTTDQTVPVPTKVADRASANSNSAVTTVDLVLTSLTVGNYLIIRSAADNSGGGGAARTMTVSNQSGTAMGTHTEYQQNNDPGAASAGTTCNVSVIKIAATSGTIRLTYAGSVVQACVAEEWSGIHATTPVVGTPVGANATTSTNLPSLTDASVAAGNVVYGIIAMEGTTTATTFNQDTDTTNGSWVGLTALGTATGGADDTNQATYGAYKTVTAAGAQTYNPTTPHLHDSAGLIVELAAASTPAPTIRAQVSWANLELPAGVTAFPHYAGINLGVNWPVDGAVSAGATDS